MLGSGRQADRAPLAAAYRCADLTITRIGTPPEPEHTRNCRVGGGSGLFGSVTGGGPPGTPVKRFASCPLKSPKKFRFPYNETVGLAAKLVFAPTVNMLCDP